MNENTFNELKLIATRLKVKWQLLYAILKNENRDLSGYNPNKTLRKRFENSVYNRLRKQDKQKTSNEELLLRATSWGLPQIMGFHYSLLGYKTAKEMVEDFQRSEIIQIRGFEKFIEKNPSLHQAIKDSDYQKISKLYNGPGYKVNKYDELLVKHYNEMAD